MQSDFLSSSSPQQYRMRRLQVFNWGTFSDLHDIPIAEEGFLFVGRSGSGKSTLLDALSALLVPPLWMGFNAAAREGDKGRHDRNLVSYIRGAWADQKDTDSGEIATQYLRPGTTWTALSVESPILRVSTSASCSYSGCAEAPTVVSMLSVIS